MWGYTLQTWSTLRSILVLTTRTTAFNLTCDGHARFTYLGAG